MSKSKNNPVIFSTVWDSDYWMSSNGMYCGFNMPEALPSTKNGESEFSHRLPPYNKRKFYLADEYPAVPKNWVPSEGRKTSYFVPVEENQGMWLDFNKNCEHKYEVAIVVSVQGVNPITGMPCMDAGLEQYIDTCPKHKISFGPNRYCEKCGYKWPKQNYISTTGTPHGNLWLDGFRTAEGVVRQYILTMDKIKGVAANILKEERVFAVGISFFLSNNPKPVRQQTVYTRGIVSMSYNGPIYAQPDFNSTVAPTLAPTTTSSSKTWNSTGVRYCEISDNNFKANIFSTSALPPAPLEAVGAASESLEETSIRLSNISNDPNLTITTHHTINVKKVEIGAGANVEQMIHDDPNTLDFWRKEPESLILINYALEKDCERILKVGKISLEGHKESFLKDIPVGN